MCKGEEEPEEEEKETPGRSRSKDKDDVDNAEPKGGPDTPIPFGRL